MIAVGNLAEDYLREKPLRTSGAAMRVSDPRCDLLLDLFAESAGYGRHDIRWHSVPPSKSKLNVDAYATI